MKGGNQKKSLSVKLGVMLFVIGPAVFGNAKVWAADWRLYASDNKAIRYYDGQGITSPSKNIVRVSNKIIFTERTAHAMAERLGKAYENLAYEISLKEINCAEKKERWVLTTLYSKKGELLHAPAEIKKEWGSIDTDTLSYTLFKKVCEGM